MESVGIIRGVLKALSAIHKHGIIHRDIKPANVMCVCVCVCHKLCVCVCVCVCVCTPSGLRLYSGSVNALVRLG